jgi:hypothetical protein
MEKAAAARAMKVRYGPAVGGKWLGNAKKVLFRGNEPKDLLTIKELELLRVKNELVLSAEKHQLKRKMRRFRCHLEQCLLRNASHSRESESTPRTFGIELPAGWIGFRGNDRGLQRPAAPVTLPPCGLEIESWKMENKVTSF